MRLLAVILALGVLGLGLLAADHHHDAVVDDECPFCQVIAHQPLEPQLLQGLLPLLLPVLLFVLPELKPARHPPGCCPPRPYHSRAPPFAPGV